MSGSRPKSKSRPEALDGEDLYAAEAILDKKVSAGKTLYFIKWVGWGHNWNTWEPEENIASESLLEEFEGRRAKGGTHRTPKRRRSIETNAQHNGGSAAAAATTSSPHSSTTNTAAAATAHKLLNKKGTDGRHKAAKELKKLNKHGSLSSSTLTTTTDHRSRHSDPPLITLSNNTLADKTPEPTANDSRKRSSLPPPQSKRRSRSTSGSRRSSVNSRRDSASASAAIVAITAEDNTNSDPMRGAPDPTVSRRVSSESENSVHISDPMLVNKKPENYCSDFDSLSSQDSSANGQSSQAVAADNENQLSATNHSLNNQTNDKTINTNTNTANDNHKQLNYEPQVVLERLPKYKFKRLLSDSYKASYEIIKCGASDSVTNSQAIIGVNNSEMLNEIIGKSDLNNNHTISDESNAGVESTDQSKTIVDRVVSALSSVQSKGLPIDDVIPVASIPLPPEPFPLVATPEPPPPLSDTLSDTDNDRGVEPIVCSPIVASTVAAVDEDVGQRSPEQQRQQSQDSAIETAVNSIAIELDGELSPNRSVEISVEDSVEQTVATTDSSAAAEEAMNKSISVMAQEIRDQLREEDSEEIITTEEVGEVVNTTEEELITADDLDDDIHTADEITTEEVFEEIITGDVVNEDLVMITEEISEQVIDSDEANEEVMTTEEVNEEIITDTEITETVVHNESSELETNEELITADSYEVIVETDEKQDNDNIDGSETPAEEMGTVVDDNANQQIVIDVSDKEVMDSETEGEVITAIPVDENGNELDIERDIMFVISDDVVVDDSVGENSAEGEPKDISVVEVAVDYDNEPEMDATETAAAIAGIDEELVGGKDTTTADRVSESDLHHNSRSFEELDSEQPTPLQDEAYDTSAGDRTPLLDERYDGDQTPVRDEPQDTYDKNCLSDSSVAPSPAIDVITKDIIDSGQLTPAADSVINNDDSIDANLVVRQPSLSVESVDDRSLDDQQSASGGPEVDKQLLFDNALREEVVEKQTLAKDTVEETAPERPVFKSFTDIFTSRLNERKDDHLFDLTFNDDIMLDTVRDGDDIHHSPTRVVSVTPTLPTTTTTITAVLTPEPTDNTDKAAPAVAEAADTHLTFPYSPVSSVSLDDIEMEPPMSGAPDMQSPPRHHYKSRSLNALFNKEHNDSPTRPMIEKLALRSDPAVETRAETSPMTATAGERPPVATDVAANGSPSGVIGALFGDTTTPDYQQTPDNHRSLPMPTPAPGAANWLSTSTPFNAQQPLSYPSGPPPAPRPPSLPLSSATHLTGAQLPHQMPPISQSHMMSTTHPSLSSHLPFSQSMPHVMNRSANGGELQTTSNIICDVMLSPSQDSSLSNMAANNHQNHRNMDKMPAMPANTQSYHTMSATSVITMNSNMQSMGPQRPSMPPNDQSVADASNWPLLSQTNNQQQYQLQHRPPPPGPPSVANSRMSAPVMPYGNAQQYNRFGPMPRSPVTSTTTRPTMHTLMPSPMRPTMSQMTSRSSTMPSMMSGSHMSLSQSQSHPYRPMVPMVSYQPPVDTMRRSSQMMPNASHSGLMPQSTLSSASAPRFPAQGIRTNMSDIRHMQYNSRPDASIIQHTHTSRPPPPQVPDMRQQRSGHPTTMSPMGANMSSHSSQLRYHHMSGHSTSQHRRLIDSPTTLQQQSMSQPSLPPMSTMSGHSQHKSSPLYERPRIPYGTPTLRPEFGGPLRPRISQPQHPHQQQQQQTLAPMTSHQSTLHYAIGTVGMPSYCPQRPQLSLSQPMPTTTSVTTSSSGVAQLSPRSVHNNTQMHPQMTHNLYMPSSMPPPMPQPSGADNHQKRVTVEAKQLVGIRDKIKQNSHTIDTNSQLPMGMRPSIDPNRYHRASSGYNPQMMEKEVEQLLAPRPQHHSQEHRPLAAFGSQMANQYNVSINNSTNARPLTANNGQILHHLLTPDTPMAHNSSHLNVINEREFNAASDLGTQMRPNSRSATNTPTGQSKSVPKDILTAAMEEIEINEVYDEAIILDTESSDGDSIVANSQPTNTTATAAATDPQSDDNSVLIFSGVTDNMTSEELMQLINSNGYSMVVENDSQEAQFLKETDDQPPEQQPEADETHSDTDIVFQIDDKMLANIPESGDVEVQFVMMDADNQSPPPELNVTNSDTNVTADGGDTTLVTNQNDAQTNENSGNKLGEKVQNNGTEADAERTVEAVQTPATTPATPTQYISMPNLFSLGAPSDDRIVANSPDSDDNECHNENSAQNNEISVEEVIVANADSDDELADAVTREEVVDNSKEATGDTIGDKSAETVATNAGTEAEVVVCDENLVNEENISGDKNAVNLAVNEENIENNVAKSDTVIEDHDKTNVDNNLEDIDSDEEIESVDKPIETTEEPIEICGDNRSEDDECVIVEKESDKMGTVVNDNTTEMSIENCNENDVPRDVEDTVDNTASITRQNDSHKCDDKLVSKSSECDDSSEEIDVEECKAVSPVDKAVDKRETSVEIDVEDISSDDEDIHENNDNNNSGKEDEEESDESIDVVNTSPPPPTTTETTKVSETRIDDNDNDKDVSDANSQSDKELMIDENDDNQRPETAATTPLAADQQLPESTVVLGSVQHPFVSSSVEDMPNSPSTASSLAITGSAAAVIAPDVAVEPQIKHKALVGETRDSTGDDQSFMPNLSDEDEEMVAVPTTTTITAINNDNTTGAKKPSADAAITTDTTGPNNGNICDNNKKNHKKGIKRSAEEVPQNHIYSSDKDSDLSETMEIRNHLLICHKKKKSIKSAKRRKTRLELSSKPPKKTMSTEEEREILQLIRTRLNGWDKGWTPDDIVGINSLDATLVFLVKWTNGKQSIVLSEVAKHKCPQLVIRFYERHSEWDESDDEKGQ